MTIKINKPITGVAVSKELPAPKKRAEVLAGSTYKLKAGEAGTYYVTINDSDGKPFEMFISTASTDSQEWIQALSFSVSALLRRLDSRDEGLFLAEKLKQVHAPKGGYWSKGKYIPSVAAGIGVILEQYITGVEAPKSEGKGKTCPECGEPTLVILDGCATCTACGYGKCG